MKEGILVVSFGTTRQKTREKNIDRLVALVRAAVPELPVYEAYSSNTVRKRLLDREGIRKMAPSEALEQMEADGITAVKILPTHLIDGVENHRLREAAERYRGIFDEVKLADVLLAKEKDYIQTADALWETLGPLAGSDPLVLMGHGTCHEADASYEKLEQVMRLRSGRDIYVATVEGRIGMEAVIKKLKSSGRKGGRILLAPFLLVAGEHAVTDMTGKDESFVVKLTAAGYDPEPVMKGIGEYPGIREIYLRHLREV